jgi:hypothetical protein
MSIKSFSVTAVNALILARPASLWKSGCAESLASVNAFVKCALSAASNLPFFPASRASFPYSEGSDICRVCQCICKDRFT